jgi:hypothetical protein
MGKSISRSLGAIVGFGILLVACSGAHTPVGGSGGFGAAGGSGGGGGNAGSGNAGGCVAGAKRCDGASVKICDDVGSKEVVVQTCLPSQSCLGAACVTTCVPNTQYCLDRAIWKCDSTGNSTKEQQCAASLFCRVENDQASCTNQACSADQPVCDGDFATTCKSDSSGPNPGGVDCSNSKQACYGGECRELACEGGTKLCEHGDVYLCTHNGTQLSLLNECTTSEVCDAEMGSCRARVCEPGKVSCDGTRAQTCNAFGSGWLSGALECAAEGKICVSGSCRKQICEPSRSRCQDDGNVYICDSTGTIATLSQTCNPQTQHCLSYGSFATCQRNECNAGDKVCSGNVIKVCNADGTLPASGTSCGDAQYCENAECKPRPCVLGSYFCKSSNVYYCDFTGPYQAEECGAEAACKAQGTSAAVCAPLACSPSSSACLGNQIGTCASDGQSLSQVTTDCTTTTSVCTTALKCEKSVLDTVGAAENAEPLYSSNVVGDVIDVDSARKLTELSMQLVFVGSRELRWIVYELSGQTFVPKVDKIVSVSNGSTGLVSSGALNFSLAAGRRYLLAVAISGGDAIDYIDSVPFPKRVSFGTVLGRVLASYPGTLDAFTVDSNYVSQMKVTTEAP